VELFDVTSAALEVAARGSELRSSVLANNLANVNTPHFKRSDVYFEDALAEAIDFGGKSSKVRGVEPRMGTDTSSIMRHDGNNVDIDREAARLAENQIFYNSVMAIESKRMRSLSSAITGAR
jgi:flagellar basal-body rod protein FlgB